MAGLLSRERILAPPGYSRWLVPPAALAIHLSIGQAYAFSVFNLPLSRAIGVTAPAPGDWKLTEIGWIFTFAIVVLGLSAAFGGRWVERVGPRKSGVVAALCWGGGFLVGALGVRLHSLPLLCFGYGVLGGCGLGVGYITPVSTLIKWFPDRRGLATGMAIMGFGGGAMIASPLSEILMKRLSSPGSVGVAETFAVLGCVYCAAMLAGAFAFRLPPAGWKPPGFVPPETMRTLVSSHDVSAVEALRTPQFYLLWAALFLNVTAGIGVLGQASAMIQEVFPKRVDASAAAGFVGLLSLFNMAGRFLWASASDHIGRKATYAAFFLLGPVLYAAAPFAGRAGSVLAFVACFAAILTMYGGGFATIPAYIADLFGTRFVGAIHGRILTAWAAAGVAGPVLVNYVREYQVSRGVEKAQVYNVTMDLIAGMLVLGLLANLSIRRVDPKHHLAPDPVRAESAADARKEGAAGEEQRAAAPAGTARQGVALAVAWTMVAVPLSWGVYATVQKAALIAGIKV
jgi:MFS family permease